MTDWGKFTLDQLIQVNEMARASKGRPKADRIIFDSEQEIFTRLDQE